MEENAQTGLLTFDLDTLSLRDVTKTYDEINEFLSFLTDLKIEMEEVDDDE